MDITSRKNEKAVHLKKLGASREYRREHGEFLCDGVKLFGEAVKFSADIHDVFICGDVDVSVPAGARVYKVTREVIEAVSPMKTPQNIVFSCGMPKLSGDIPPGAVVLENIQDPGNVGTVLRTAGAFGISAVALVGASADPFSPKTIRATMGAVFRKNIIETDLDGLRCLKESGVDILAAAISDDARDIRDTDLSNCVIAIGNEGSGLSKELLELSTGRVIIPMAPECESLNAAVAASVIMWEMARSVRR